MSTTKTTGFYATDVETYFVTESGRTFIVYSADDLGTDKPVEINGLPSDATPVPADADLAARAELISE